MKTCIKCGSHAFNLYADGIDQGGFCDVHYWQGRAHRAEAHSEQEPVAIELALAGLVEKITGGIDSGDLLADAVTASKMLDAQPKQPISVQPEQEPVAWEQFYPDIGKPQLKQEPSITKEARGTLILHSGWDDLPNGTKFYTTQPKRPWVGLTDEQREECTQSPFTEDNYQDIEDKLRELNT